MASVHALPLEIRVLIIAYLPSASVKNLSLCTRHFRDITLPYVFTNIHFSFKGYLFDEFRSLFQCIRTYIKHITISVPSPIGLDVQMFFRYFKAVGLSLHIFNELQSLKILYTCSKAVSDAFSHFDEYTFGLLFCPRDDESGTERTEKEQSEAGRGRLSHYKTLKTLEIRINMIYERWSADMEKFLNHESTLQQLPSEITSSRDWIFRPPTILPALQEFSVMVDPQYVSYPEYGESSSTHDLVTRYGDSSLLSLLKASTESLEGLSVWTRIDSIDTGPLIMFPNGLVFPNVKKLRYHSWYLWCDDPQTLEIYDDGGHLEILVQVAPNVEDIALYIERQLLFDLTIESLDKAFQEFRAKGMSSLKKARMGWPRGVGVEELGEKILEWKYDGFEKLEKMVFVRVTDGEDDIKDDSFEAISGVVLRNKDDIWVVKWSEIYMEKLLNIELEDWLYGPGRSF